MTPSHITRKQIICEGVMALFSKLLYVGVAWLFFFQVICDGIMALLTYNQEENKAMTPSHITRKKIKP
jgi:hypothetical protein